MDNKLFSIDVCIRDGYPDNHLLVVTDTVNGKPYEYSLMVEDNNKELKRLISDVLTSMKKRCE